MFIDKLLVENYRALKKVDVNFNKHLNIIVGDNETGKSTLLEAINLALSGQLNGRNVQYELHPFLFNTETVVEYIENLKQGETGQPPKILIELYLEDNESLARLKGTNNTLRENCPGVSLSVEFDESYSSEYADYTKFPDQIRNVPIEYYSVIWRSFAGENITSRSVPLKPTMIDASTIRHNTSANKYVLDIVKDHLSPEQRVQLSLSYRKMKDVFLEEENVKAINDNLATKQGHISSKNLSVSLDTTSRASWETGIMPQLDEIPLPLVGKGEQNSIKIKLAMDASDDAHVFLIEEPENHLSYPNLNNLIARVAELSDGKQLIITTHSSFVLNKLGVENVLLFNRDKNITLKQLSSDTYDYFMKLPGHDTLRLILTQKAILVEGPSDELIVQKAFLKRHNCMPLEKGIDVITVKSLAFKRFLEIAKLLNIEVNVVTDNDGDIEKLKKKYEGYKDDEKIKIYYDMDINAKTLEPQLLKANSLLVLNNVLGTGFANDGELLNHMESNKTDCALKIFNTDADINFPEYINNAIRE